MGQQTGQSSVRITVSAFSHPPLNSAGVLIAFIGIPCVHGTVREQEYIFADGSECVS